MDFFMKKQQNYLILLENNGPFWKLLIDNPKLKPGRIWLLIKTILNLILEML